MLGWFGIKIPLGRWMDPDENSIQIGRRDDLKSNLFGVGCRDGGPAPSVSKVNVVGEREVAGHDCELGRPPREGGLAIVSDLLLIVDFEVL